jgi:microsomal epoxide hydrolase
MPAEIWRAQIEHFAAAHRVVAFDPRGQGASAVPRDGYRVERRARDIAELLDQLGPRPVVLVGWSLGVLEALAYVKFHGAQRVQALVLVDNSIGEEPPPKSDPTFLPRLKKDRVKTVNGFVRGMYRQPQPESYYQRIVAASLQVPLDGAVALLSYPYPREFWKNALYATDLPVLYAVTERFRGQGENLKKHRPEAWVEVFPRAGHALFVDEAERFNQLLDDFLRQAVATRAARRPGATAS